MSARSFRYWLEGVALRVLIMCLSPLSIDQSSALGAWVMKTAGKFLKQPNRVAMENLCRVMPEEKARELLPAIWANLGRIAFEYPKLRTLPSEPERIEIVNPHHIVNAANSGKGAILVAAHMGNWELFPVVFDQLNSHAALIYRAPNNPITRKLVQGLRLERGVTYVPKSSQGMRQVLTRLAKGELVGYLTDHRYSEALPVDFLGGKARLPTTAALLAKRFGAPIICCRIERIDGARFKASFADPIEVEKGEASPETMQALTQQIVTRFEGWIMERPDQWFWMQKLWAKGDN